MSAAPGDAKNPRPDTSLHSPDLFANALYLALRHTTYYREK